MPKHILVAGGAGYIGSHTVKELQNQGNEITVFDNLIYGHKEAVSCSLVAGDLLNKTEVEKIFQKNKFDAVIHFAAYSQAGESMENPAKYFENNIQGGLNLLEEMRKNDVKHIIFSSTAAVYGFPKNLPVKETDEYKPSSVYGESKLAFERILKWYDEIFGIKSVCLRYFNACGASLDGSIGEDHKPETHIIPIAMQAALGQRKSFNIFGNDYNTPDGTCIRDYIHVLDLAFAHIKALDYLSRENMRNTFNLGTGRGYSNKEIIDMVKKIAGVDFPVIIGPRRPGDPDAVYADSSKAKSQLNWEAKYSDIETIIETAWNWHKSHPEGY